MKSTPNPTVAPSAAPFPEVTTVPTKSPSPGPSPVVTSVPTKSPSPGPSSGPTDSPSSGPTDSPSSGPTDSPSSGPTESPSSQPSEEPTSCPEESDFEICNCAPNTFEFTLDFGLFCPPVNLTIGDALQTTTCMVSPFGDPTVTDLIPVAVQSIDILELNQDLQVVVQESIDGTFGDGDTFQYTSYAAISGEIVNPVDLPRAIQLNINGVNQFDESIINVYLVSYTNNCGAYPVLVEGESV
ncbi:MAG: hypothetical protein SGILL_004139, partial [Bacillariaceae sp.]